MSGQRATGVCLGLALAISALLGACAMQPAKPPPRPAVVTALPEVAAPVTPATTAPAAQDFWTTMTAGFVMHDCADAPLINAKAAFFTRHPQAFEQLLQQSLPLMIYVQKQLHAAGIPDEFVMLPMLESSYDPAERSRHGDAAGMWQLMPRTARLRGVKVTREYDGRRDPVASTTAAITMLNNLHQRFKDWRIVDMAYNAGPYAVMQALRHHPELGDGAIPNIPVAEGARKHLAKLMALSCIIKDPAQFHVTLPKATSGNDLVAVQLPAGTRIADAADMAEITETSLRAWNPGYLGRRIPAASPGRLLLPATAAQALVAALAVDSSESVAQVTAPTPDASARNALPLPAEPSPPPSDDSTPTPAAAPVRHHRVRAGDTLWSIARHYHVSVKDLQRWNHLDGHDIHPGEELRVQG
ncbi:MAG TPA: transglycosylase SLT domain-containing protein [Rhodanobacteraceae bacterium]|nr:transglycosylase SLT domain-containing protein [Rhodanobacteraceae bacterium]